MKVSFHLMPRSQHQVTWGRALRAGMERHGETISTGTYNVAGKADIAVVWTWRQLALINAMQASGRRVLVMERGHIQPRREWCSLAFDGLNGRGKYPPPGNNSRFRKHFAHHLRPWRRKDGPVLLVGQVEGDAALHGLDMEQWARKTAAALLRQGRQVIWRPHPRSRHTSFCPDGAERSHSSLEDDLGRCSVVVVWSSTTAVESVLAGVPTITLDKGAMAWPVAGHDLTGNHRHRIGAAGAGIWPGGNGRWPSSRAGKPGRTSARSSRGGDMPSALILGGASCLWDDADVAVRLTAFDAILAVNNAITDWPWRLDYAVSLHQEPTKHYPGLVKAVERRKDRHRPQIWSHRPGKGVDRTTSDWGGSSGLFAVRIALEEGFTRIVLAGVPMTVEGEHYHARGKWTACANYRKQWLAHQSYLDGKVKSLSGWTKELLGEPTPDWINSD